MLADHGVAWVLNDLPYLPRAIDDPAARRLTADWSYLRLIGRHDAPVTDDVLVDDRGPELDRWAALARDIAARPGATDIFVLTSNSYEGHSPATARRLAERIGAPIAPIPLDTPPPTEPEPAQLSMFEGG